MLPGSNRLPMQAMHDLKFHVGTELLRYLRWLREIHLTVSLCKRIQKLCQYRVQFGTHVEQHRTSEVLHLHEYINVHLAGQFDVSFMY